MRADGGGRPAESERCEMHRATPGETKQTQCPNAATTEIVRTIGTRTSVIRVCEECRATEERWA